MDAQKAIDHFGSPAGLAAALGITTAAVYQWRSVGKVPRGRAFQLQVLTGGALRVDERLYQPRSLRG